MKYFYSDYIVKIVDRKNNPIFIQFNKSMTKINTLLDKRQIHNIFINS